VRRRITAAALVCVLGGAACSSSTGTGVGEGRATLGPAAAPVPSTPLATNPPETVPATSPPETLSTSTTTTSTKTTSTTTTTSVPTTTPYLIPLVNAQSGGWGDTHSRYPATDLFENGCGNGIVSPVNGALIEVRRVNSYDSNVDNPATRGGRSVSILGDDGVRYYLAHFELIDEALAVDTRVTAGQYLGTIGTTGRSSACHVHFGISPPCSNQEWSVRRGVVWPYTYLNDWSRGGQLSPVEEVAAWVASNPDTCAAAAADPFAPDA
jgi:murein DD-endopeptidase MepM/ murein hydrolase activator NlpD